MALPAIMRTDDHHVEKHGKILELTKTAKIGVVFIGDSITRRWEDNPELWDLYFKKYDAVNFGVGCDTIENLKWRVLNGELDGISPRLLVMLIGTNNLSTHGAEDIAGGIEDVLRIARRKLPASRLILMGLLPRAADDSGVNFREKIDRVNEDLGRIVLDDGYFFYNPGNLFLTPDGRLRAELFSDGLHLNAEGYKVLGPDLVRLIERFGG